MLKVNKTFKIAITISEFGNLAKFYKTYAKNNRLIEINEIEFEGTEDQHNAGIMTDTIVCTRENLLVAVTKFVDTNYLRGECFSVTEEGNKKTIMTEADFPRY